MTKGTKQRRRKARRSNRIQFRNMEKYDLWADRHWITAGSKYKYTGCRLLEEGDINGAVDNYRNYVEERKKHLKNFHGDLEPQIRKAWSDDILKYQKKADRLEKVKAGKWHALEGRAKIAVTIIGLLGGLFFLSSNVTGNVIGSNESTGNIFGVVLICVGLVAGFFWIKDCHKK